MSTPTIDVRPGPAIYDVRREVARARRTREELSVLLVRLPRRARRRRPMRAILSHTARIVRSSDRVLPYGDGHVAVVLPATGGTAAQRVMERITASRRSIAGPGDCHIAAYHADIDLETELARIAAVQA